MTMIWLLWPWNQWHHWETLATCLIIILTASTAPPPTVSILSSYLSRLVIIQVQECYQKYISRVYSWHVWLSKHRFTRVWQQRIWPRVLLPSDFKWVNKKKQQQQQKNIWSYLHPLYFDSFLISHHFIDRSVHQARERRVPIETTTGATS